jgi:GTPase
MLAVGDCEWVEGGILQQSRLLVAEAYVRPDHLLVPQDHQRESDQGSRTTAHTYLPQLRISLTGATMSGKSSLLGTLSTGTLDNGRGKSRLSLLKHRHEIESGVTSSITQELIGYGDLLGPDGSRSLSQIINYGCTDISSWPDIHASADSLTAGKLLFLTDSAGHPRFRRTTVRGLVGWDPHYTLLCIPADNIEDGASSSSRENPGCAADLDLSGELLRLCLSLELPLVIVITKYDLAKKAGLKSVLTRVLSTLKDAGRTGRIIADPSTPLNASLETISTAELLEAEGVSQAFKTTPLATVPIVLTSALSGTGLRKLHALLRTLPVPVVATPRSVSRNPLFHIEDIYMSHSARNTADKPTIVGGHLSSGDLNIGDELMLGPYPIDTSPDDSDSGSGRLSFRNSPLPTSRSYPGALQKSTAHSHMRTGSSALFEWRPVRVTSLRNLRLPVSTLHSGQVGTLGMVPIHAPISSPTIIRIRKGMVLSKHNPKAHKTIMVQFSGPQAESAKVLTVGSAVVVFFASVRAPSKVLSVTPMSSTIEATAPPGDDAGPEEEGWFGFDEDSASDPGDGASGGGATSTAVTTIVQFQFIGGREFVGDGVKVLVMPGGGPGLSGSIERGEKGLAGLEGFVGRVVDESA